MFSIKVYGADRNRENQQLIFVGPYTGSWGHLFHFHIPIVNRLREQNPDAFLVSAGYVGDDYYYKDNNGNRTIDAYISFPTDPNIRRVYGLGQAAYHEDIQQADMICRERFGPVTINHRTPNADNEWFHFLSQMPRTEYRLGSFAGPNFMSFDYIMVHSKNARGLSDRNTKGVEIANADFETDKEYVKLLAQHYPVYVIGIPDECNRFEGPGITDWTQLTAEERPIHLLNMTAHALCMVSTSSSSTANYAMSVGCPSICFACRRYRDNYDTKYNHFGAPTRHHELFPFDPEMRVKDTLDFLDTIKGKPRYNGDVLRIDTDLVSKWL